MHVSASADVHRPQGVEHTGAGPAALDEASAVAVGHNSAVSLSSVLRALHTTHSTIKGSWSAMLLRCDLLG